MKIVNEVTGKDYTWFFDVYVFDAKLPDLQSTRDASGLALEWKTNNNRPFPMPVEVRVGDSVRTLPMSDGRGRVEIPAGATYTIDPGSKLFRHEPHMDAFQKYEEQQNRGRRR